MLCELEGARAGTKAFTAARAGGIRQKQPKNSPNQFDTPAGGVKGKGKAKGKRDREKIPGLAIKETFHDPLGGEGG